ncbi:chemotaxis protein CheV [Bowmanella sp. JS7-9]|uniref:Chemotaxis protein CheV n=1 Tax=Pseudobowmanella zhangzhouensis TaxID=1537679 RepID=A0ABW1XLN7_9ALTE|nr:chemotaxis protein CheV [Bowmanella sp. JS7-9]TBX20629.1 chemotaxis protein CheW [Bowmanella sp. JS7-9]
MSGVLAAVDQRTKLVGENRLELLLFRLHGMQVFALNVFKIREVITVPKMNMMPGSHPNMRGVTNYRGKSIPIIDLRMAIRMPASRPVEDRRENVIITEYNRSVQGFYVGEVLNIVNTSWSDIQPPPSTAGRSNYLTAITRCDIEGQQRLVEIIDVEKVLAEIIDYDISISEDVLDEALVAKMPGRKVLIVDDSATARMQSRQTLEQLGLEIIEDKNGLDALKRLQAWADEGKSVSEELLLMITDAEMPEMDGYRLTAEVRSDPRMQDLYIVLNTSLSGSFNQAMVEKVGCNAFISKFQPDLLVTEVQARMARLLEQK